MIGIEITGLDKLIDKQEKRLRALASEAIQDAAAEVVVRTPVDTGFARASWWASINSDSGSSNAVENSVAAGDKIAGQASQSGAPEAIGRLAVTINGVQIGDTLTVGNSASYIAALEDGTSNMAPFGMVAATVNNWPQIVAFRASELARR